MMSRHPHHNRRRARWVRVDPAQQECEKPQRAFAAAKTDRLGSQDADGGSFQLPPHNEILFVKAAAQCIPIRKFRSMQSRCRSTPRATPRSSDSAAQKSVAALCQSNWIPGEFAPISLFAENFLTRHGGSGACFEYVSFLISRDWSFK